MNAENIEQTVLALLGNVDALETELTLIKSENEALVKRVGELENIIKQKTQGC